MRAQRLKQSLDSLGYHLVSRCLYRRFRKFCRICLCCIQTTQWSARVAAIVPWAICSEDREREELEFGRGAGVVILGALTWADEANG